MIHLDHLLDATSGTLLRRGRYTHFDTFNQDSRQLVPGELFVAVRGERSDGHDYLLDAVHRGASGLLIEERVVPALTEEQRAAFEQAGVTTVVVEDTRLALQRYAHAILRRWHPIVIAVTGSAGKTSTKEAIAAMEETAEGAPKRFTAYGVTLGDDPVAQAMKGLIDHTAGHEHQIALLWAAIEMLSNPKPNEECVPSDAQKTEDFDADHLKQLMR